MSVFGKAATYAFVKEYIAHQLFNDLPKAAAKAYRRIDTDKVLHKAGLARYRPGTTSATSVGLFALGCAIGGVAALLWAPKPGSEFRTEVKGKAMDFIQQQRGQYAGEKTTAQA